jgi:putative ABC transport system permease protein
MSPIAVVLVGMFAIVYGSLAVVAVRRPLLRRLAWREAARRRGQSALVVVGLTVGSAAMLGGQLFGDSVGYSSTADSYRYWGRVDLLVTGGQPFSPRIAAALSADPSVRSAMVGAQAGVELIGPVADLDQRLSKPAVRLIGFDPASQPSFGAFVMSDGRRTFGQDLAAGEALVSRSLARALDIKVGDQLRVSPGQLQAGAPVEIRAAGIVRAEGPGAYGLRPSVFAPLATMKLLTGTDLVNVVRASAPGEGPAELAAAHRLASAMRSALKSVPGGRDLQVLEVKANEIKAGASDNGPYFMLVLTSLVLLAGAALVVNLALALAEERRPRLAVLRALGLSRRGLITLSVMEGAIYSIAATVGAVIPAILLVWFFVSHGAGFFGSSDGLEATPQLIVRPESVAIALAATALLTLAALFAAAVRASRMTISSAIKDLPEPAREPRRSWRRIAWLFALGLVATPAVILDGVPGRVLGGSALIVVVAALARGRLPDRVRASVAGAALTAWALGVINTMPKDDSAGWWVLSVVVAVFGLSTLVAANLRVLESLAALPGGRAARLPALLRPPLAYLTRRPVRTGLATGTFALVLTMLSLTAVMTAVFQPNYQRDSAGFEIKVSAPARASITLPASAAAQVARQAAIPTWDYFGLYRESSTEPWQNFYLHLYQLSGAQLQDPPFHLSHRQSRFSSDAEVWRALRDDPTLVVANWPKAGGTKILVGQNGPVVLHVVGEVETGIIGDGLIAPARTLAPLTAGPAGTTVLLQTRAGVDPASIAKDIERSLFADGVGVATTRDLLDAGASWLRGVTLMIDLIMRLGLVVGVLSLGVMALRAVVERRRALGLLRAVGYQKRDVLIGLIAEVALTATIGMLIGIGLGILVGVILVSHTINGGSFRLDIGGIVSAILLVYGAMLLVVLAPALRASRLPPAEALRLVD